MGFNTTLDGDIGFADAKITVAEIPEGYRISSTGEVVGYGDARLKDSPDGEFHWCSVAGADDNDVVRFKHGSGGKRTQPTVLFSAHGVLFCFGCVGPTAEVEDPMHEHAMEFS